MRAFLAALAVLSAFAAFASPAQAATRQQWDACGNQNDAKASIQACSQIIAANKETKAYLAIAFTNRGFSYQSTGELDRAISDLTRAIELDPSKYEAYQNRAVAYSKKPDWEHAIADYSKAIGLKPDSVSALHGRGVAYYRTGNLDGAIADITRVAEVSPQSKEFKRDLGLVHAERGYKDHRQSDYDAAMRLFDEILKADAKYAHAINGRSLIFNRLGDYDSAIAEAERVLEILPNFAPALANRGFARLNKGEYDLAIADMSRAIEHSPKLANPWRHRGYAYLKQGKLDLARPDIEKSLELNPDYEDARTALAELEQAEAARKLLAERPKPEEAKPVTAEAKPATPTVALGKRLALVIGNANYRHTPALANPKNDAADMAAALKRLGFEVIFEQDLDKRAMDDAFRRFAREVRGADAALFYYAGHAMQFEGVNYLMPVDAQLRDEADVAYEMAKLDDIVADMARMNGVRIAVLDACRNNPLEEKLKRSVSLTRGVAPQRGLARVARPEGLVVAYSTQSGNVAEDGSGRNSPFTAALLGHIETPGLEVGPLFRRVMGSVKQATGGKQHPELSILFDGEFYFKPGS